MARRNMLIPGMIIFTIVTGGATILLALIGGTLDWLAGRSASLTLISPPSKLA